MNSDGNSDPFFQCSGQWVLNQCAFDTGHLVRRAEWILAPLQWKQHGEAAGKQQCFSLLLLRCFTPVFAVAASRQQQTTSKSLC